MADILILTVLREPDQIERHQHSVTRGAAETIQGGRSEPALLGCLDTAVLRHKAREKKRPRRTIFHVVRECAVSYLHRAFADRRDAETPRQKTYPTALRWSVFWRTRTFAVPPRSGSASQEARDARSSGKATKATGTARRMVSFFSARIMLHVPRRHRTASVFGVVATTRTKACTTIPPPPMRTPIRNILTRQKAHHCVVNVSPLHVYVGVSSPLRHAPCQAPTLA